MHIAETGSGNTRLRALRLARGLAGYGLAVHAKCSPSTIGAIERWGHRPSAAVCARIATALGVTVADIWPSQEVPCAAE